MTAKVERFQPSNDHRQMRCARPDTSSNRSFNGRRPDGYNDSIELIELGRPQPSLGSPRDCLDLNSRVSALQGVPQAGYLAGVNPQRVKQMPEHVVLGVLIAVNQCQLTDTRRRKIVGDNGSNRPATKHRKMLLQQFERRPPSFTHVGCSMTPHHEWDDWSTTIDGASVGSQGHSDQ
jgi:hypothetical protein